MSAARPDPSEVDVAVDRILADDRLVYFPVKHFSPTCAWHLRALIGALRPAAVLVEGPDDADALIPHIVDPATRPPLTLLSVYADRKNRFGLNGVQSPSPDVPARFRSWWPFTDASPEYNALRAGHEVGAALHFIDLPLAARIPFTHTRTGRAEAPSDHGLGFGRYFEALRTKGRFRSFDELWGAHFEVGALHLSPEAFRRRVLTFAWCARHAGGGPTDTDGTLTREAHMRYHIDRAAKLYPEGPIVVVTGAFHSVALPFTKRRRAKSFRDAGLDTLLVAHSFRALSRLYALERLPAYNQAVWEALLEGRPRPFDAAAARLLVRVMREARADRGGGPSTADAVGAWDAARRLASLRGNPEVTLHDLTDAAQMSYVKGDRRLMGGTIERATREVLVGRAHGHVTPEAGQVPLRSDFYARCKTHRLDVTGAAKTVRLDLHKQRKHRPKSALLHQCDFLDVPFFGALDSHAGHFRGPDPSAGANLHLITETWAIRWTEEVDDRLLELADRGASMAEAAASRLRDALADAADDAAAAARLLLRCAQMMLVDHFDATLGVVDAAIAADRNLVRLVDGLADFVHLHRHADTLATRGDDRVLRTITTLFVKAALALPAAAYADPSRQRDVLDRVQTLVRIALTFEATPLDVDLLVSKVRELVAVPEGAPGARGAAFGVLFAFGEIGPRDKLYDLV